MKVFLTLFFLGLSFLSAEVPQKADETSLDLSGSWDFYWSELLVDPAEAKNEPKSINVPSDWHEAGIPGVTKFGFATYFKEIVVQNDGSLGLKIDHIFSSYTLYINGELLYASGEVGTSREAYRPYREPKVFSIPEQFGDQLKITIQSANYDHLNSGIYYKPILGNYAELERELRLKQGISLFLAGGFFITGFILFGFSLSSRQLALPVFFYALFSLSLMYRMLGASPYPLHALVPSLNFYLAITLEYLAIHTAALFGGLFIFETFKKYTSPVLTRVFYIGSSISMAIVLFGGPVVFTTTLKYYLFFILLYVVIFTKTIVRAKLAKAPSSNYLTAALVIVFIWTLFQAITFLNIGVIPFYINVILVSGIIVMCNLALFQTFLKRIAQSSQRESQLEIANTKNTLLSLISHEIKIPVAALQMNLAMLNKAKDNEKLLEKIKDKSISTASKSVESIKEMINDFLFFMSSDQTEKEMINVVDLKKTIERELSEDVFIKEIHKPIIESHEVTLLYVIRTLINNAYKHTRTAIRKPEIHIFNKDNYLGIEIRDFGDGITDEAIEALGKSKRKVSDNHEVEGMGFYMANELCDQLGHNLMIGQNEWNGTSAIVYIKQ